MLLRACVVKVNIALSLLVALSSFAAARPARAQHWEHWATGLTPGVYPTLAIAPSPARDVYYSFLLPATGTGRVWRARIDSATPTFTLMPSFPLPTPTAGMTAPNVNSITTNRRGEAVVGLTIPRSDNTDPLIVTWDETAGHWFTPPLRPATSVCAHSIYRVDRAPNGDLWAICQWHGAYRSTDDGRSFDYVDISALLHVSTPSYFPTRAANIDYLGAIYSIAFDVLGTIYVGTETGGEVMSSDGGATWHPLDSDSANPMSTMARATNSGDDYGTGVTVDGRVVFTGTPGLGAYPPGDPTRLYVVDRAAHSVTVARGIPDYWLGGRTQFATLRSGEMFFHSNHDTVGRTTGTPQIGGIMMSTNGVDWSPMNTGIDEVSAIPGMGIWVDGNGRGASGGFALDANTLYTVTQRGNVYRFVPAGTTTADAGTDAAMASDAGASIDTAVSLDVGAAIDASMAIDTGLPLDAAAVDAATTRDASTSRSDAGAAQSSLGGCACRTAGPRGSSHASTVVALAVAAVLVRRRLRA